MHDRRHHGSCVSVAVLTTLLGLLLPAAVGYYNLQSYTNVDGLPQLQVTALAEGPRGYLWIGTYGGLARFNGAEFRPFGTAEGLSHNEVDALAVVGGELVVVTAGPHFCRYLPTSERFECHAAPEALADSIVQAVRPIQDRGLMVLTPQGLSQVDLDGNWELPRSDDPLAAADGLGCSDVDTDASGRVWMTCGCELMESSGSGWIRHRAPLATAELTIVRATADGVLAGGRSGLWRVRQGAWHPIAVNPALSGAALNDAIVLPDGNAWIATSRGAVRVGPGGLRWVGKADGLINRHVQAVATNRAGDIWFGTHAGLVHYIPGTFRAYGTGAGLPGPFVRGLAEGVSGRLWVGTRDGPAYLDGRRMKPVDLGDENRNYTYAIEPISEGHTLFGTRAGIVERRGSRVRSIDLPFDAQPSVYGFAPDGEGGYWVGTSLGLARLSSANRTSWHGNIEGLDGRILTIGRDPRGRIWLGRTRGVSLLLPDGEVTQYDRADGLTDQAVWDLDFDRDGAVWFASNGDGLFRIVNGQIEHYTSADGLVDDFVWQVLADRDGSVWAYTNRGLSRLQGDHFRLYSRDDGLIDLEGSATAAIQDSRGRRWFGTASGLHEYVPESDRPALAAPPVTIESVVNRFGEPLTAGQKIQRNATPLRVEFSVLTFRDRAKMLYQVWLEGLDDAWSSPGRQNRLSLAAVPPGDYVLHVRSTNRAMSQYSPVASFPFSVAPPWWALPWVRAIAGLAALSLALGAILLRDLQAKRARRALEIQVAERTAALQREHLRVAEQSEQRRRAEEARHRLEQRLTESEKMEALGRLAGGIAHDFNNLLTGMIGYASILRDRADDDADRAALDHILDAGERAGQLTRQLLAFRQTLPAERRPVDLASTLPVVWQEMQDDRKGTTADTWRGSSEPLWIEADPALLSELFLAMARPSDSERPGSLRVRLCRAEASEVAEVVSRLSPPDATWGARGVAKLRIAHVDDGMTREERRRAFEPFFLHDRHGADGLGLASALGLVSQLNGVIELSGDGIDSIFTVYWPLVDPPQQPSATGSTSWSTPAAVATAAGTRVLVVDDETSIRELIVSMLQDAGYEVLEAGDGEEALETIHQADRPIDVLISDLIMPRANGCSVARHLWEKYPQARVVLMTGYAADIFNTCDATIRDRARVLTKPFPPRQLLTVIDDELAPAARGEAAHRAAH